MEHAGGLVGDQLEAGQGPGAAHGSGSGPGRQWAGLERGQTPGEPVRAW